jgi:hypothetical protein
MTEHNPCELALPDAAERTRLNAGLLAHGHDSGFWDEHGVLALWPDDIEEWRPSTSEPVTSQPGEQPF